VWKTYWKFIRALAVNRLGKIGVLLAALSFVIFLLLEAARIAGILRSARIGLMTYMALPALFIIGLLLIPLGWDLLRRRTGGTVLQLLNRKFDSSELEGGFFGSKLVLKAGFLTLVGLLFVIFAGARMLSFMDQPRFCGTACHSVMNPEWVTFQQSPHASIRCVDCHVGEGVDALVKSKLNGLWEILSVTLDLLERPIPTPIHQLRPARETCEKCHWPDKFYGTRLKTYTRYRTDEASTPSYTTLMLKIDTGKKGEKAGIHWHIGPTNQIRYSSVDDEREKIIRVEVLERSAVRKRFYNSELAGADGGLDNDMRVMDCVDCHNRATHIYEDPEQALDERISAERVGRNLPFIKREALRVLTNDYPDKEAAMAAVERQIKSFYRRYYPELAASEAANIETSIRTLQSIYGRNIHPEMNIEWGSYSNHINHDKNGGCFRCHNENMVSDDGEHISYECTSCHSFLAYGESDPLKYLMPVRTRDRESEMHRYLREEFLDGYAKYRARPRIRIHPNCLLFLRQRPCSIRRLT